MTTDLTALATSRAARVAARTLAALVVAAIGMHVTLLVGVNVAVMIAETGSTTLAAFVFYLTIAAALIIGLSVVDYTARHIARILDAEPPFTRLEAWGFVYGLLTGVGAAALTAYGVARGLIPS